MVTYWCPHGLDSRESYTGKQRDSIGIRRAYSILFSCFNFPAQSFFHSHILAGSDSHTPNSSLGEKQQKTFSDQSSGPIGHYSFSDMKRTLGPCVQATHSLSMVKNFMVLLVKSRASCQLISFRLHWNCPFTGVIVTTGDSFWDQSFLNSTVQQASACFPSSKSR